MYIFLGAIAYILGAIVFFPVLDREFQLSYDTYFNGEVQYTDLTGAGTILLVILLLKTFFRGIAREIDRLRE